MIICMNPKTIGDRCLSVFDLPEKQSLEVAVGSRDVDSKANTNKNNDELKIH